jgi:hypothetical protein
MLSSRASDFCVFFKNYMVIPRLWSYYYLIDEILFQLSHLDNVAEFIFVCGQEPFLCRDPLELALFIKIFPTAQWVTFCYTSGVLTYMNLLLGFLYSFFGQK